MTGVSDTAIRTYSRRLLAPFSGQVQIAETGDARALSLDGRNWEIQYQLAGRIPPAWVKSGDRQVYQYVRVAGVGDGRVSRYPLHHLLDPGPVTSAIDRLGECLLNASVPFPTKDLFEYWLLDDADRQPLALVSACIDEEEVATSRARPQWITMPAAQLEIKKLESADAGYVTPVNYRLQKLVEQRAGKHPQGSWFERAAGDENQFPPCLLREDWTDEAESNLCQRYIKRMAPRLLTLQRLSDGDRGRLEQAARDFAVEVEQFHALFPETVDQKLIKTLLVEARMRRAASGNG